VILYPAIDIRGGRCVRLVEGDFNRETAFDADPADAAARWANAGAEWIHVVDLDGSVAGEPVNVEAIRRIRNAVDVPIQLGGGLRTEDQLAAAFDLGINRAVLGTAAIRTPDLIPAAVARWGGAIAAGLDARDGKLAANGWLEQTAYAAIDAAADFERQGVQHFVLTDIRRDGTLQGPNLDALAEIRNVLTTGQVIASGGVGTLDDLLAIAATGVAGAIVGRALYDGRVDLPEALEALRTIQPAQIGSDT
jgi:phosphoribosylformimino-5-aminoimidazole carboxamide ribotide isomerase